MKQVRIDKDYCSSTVWWNHANWEESDFDFNEKQMALAKKYDDLWEESHCDVYNVDIELYRKATEARNELLEELVSNRPDIIWTYWCDEDRQEKKYASR